jgi:dTDP-4-dehydrorhamnose reductase
MAELSVCAVILTYNRRALLEECLAAITAQNREPDSIIVIDNGSTDDTFDVLQNNWGEFVDVYSLPKNVGAAGGFSAAFRLGHESGKDLLWIMDDDVIPDADALERLIAGKALLDERGIEHPYLLSNARSLDGLPATAAVVDTRLNSRLFQEWPMLVEYGMLPLRNATFVSILIPREVLDRHGLPIADMFIWGEDKEYTTRITADRSGWFVASSKVVHARAAKSDLNIRTEDNPVRVKYHFWFIRNDIFQARARRRFLWALVRYAMEIPRVLAAREPQKAVILIRGISAGMFFKPRLESIDSPFDRRGIRVLTRQAGNSGSSPDRQSAGGSG